jgi:hypothetical protein
VTALQSNGYMVRWGELGRGSLPQPATRVQRTLPQLARSEPTEHSSGDGVCPQSSCKGDWLRRQASQGKESHHHPSSEGSSHSSCGTITITTTTCRAEGRGSLKGRGVAARAATILEAKMRQAGSGAVPFFLVEGQLKRPTSLLQMWRRGSHPHTSALPPSPRHMLLSSWKHPPPEQVHL